MPDIYEQHKAAFNQVSAFVMTNKKGKRVATIAFKFPKDGAGRLYCYFHLFGGQMVRGHANGYGYDKISAAAYHAAMNIDIVAAARGDGDQVAFRKTVIKIQTALRAGESGTWSRELEKAGYNILSAI